MDGDTCCKESDQIEEVQSPISHTDNEMEADIGNIPDNFIDIEVWDQLGKDLQDFTFEDMKKLSIKTLSLCVTFYTMYAKAKGFGVRHITVRTSRVDGKPTSKNMCCNRQGSRSLKFIDNPDRKRKSRVVTRCGCQALIKFKWDEGTDTWYVKEFIDKHNHDLVIPEHLPFERYMKLMPFCIRFLSRQSS